MAFTINDFSDLKQLLVEHPELRVELRDLLLSEDFRALPAIVRDLVESVRQLAEAQQRAEQRLMHVEDRLTRLEEIVAQLAKAQQRTEDRVGQMDGTLMELQYERKAPSYFGRWIRGISVVDGNELTRRFETHLSPDELDEVLLTDLVVRGRAVSKPGNPEVWLAVEISSVVDRSDLDRALARAELLRRGDVLALPVVAGKILTAGARNQAQQRGVAVLQDGGKLFWDEAFAIHGPGASP